MKKNIISALLIGIIVLFLLAQSAVITSAQNNNRKPTQIGVCKKDKGHKFCYTPTPTPTIRPTLPKKCDLYWCVDPIKGWIND